MDDILTRLDKEITKRLTRQHPVNFLNFNLLWICFMFK